MKLKDIAQEAGVSISTVSRVLNDKHTNAAEYGQLSGNMDMSLTTQQEICAKKSRTMSLLRKMGTLPACLHVPVPLPTYFFRLLPEASNRKYLSAATS